MRVMCTSLDKDAEEIGGVLTFNPEPKLKLYEIYNCLRVFNKVILGTTYTLYHLEEFPEDAFDKSYFSIIDPAEEEVKEWEEVERCKPKKIGMDFSNGKDSTICFTILPDGTIKRVGMG